MKKLISLFAVCLILLLSVNTVFAGEGTTEKYSLWFGSHYTEFSDYTKQVGKYDLGDDEFMPEFKVNYISKSSNGMFSLDGHYYDDHNVYGKVRTTVGNTFKANFKYRSMILQEGQDLLTVMEAREYLPSSGNAGGKMLTHEILDPNADYNTHRQEISSNIEAKLSNKYNMRLVVAHRSILKNGTEQKIASTHCFSCHMTSVTAQVDQTQHQIEAGIDVGNNQFDLGYRFGYRVFENHATNATVNYEDAKHPVNGGAAGEFGPRVIYDDATLEFSTYPKTEKMSHRLRLKKELGNGTVSGSASYSKTENKYTDLSNEAYTGHLGYAFRMDNNTRMNIKVAVQKLQSDDPFIDLPTFRDGATDGNTYDFDYTRYSSLDRMVSKIDAEMIKRLTPKVTLSLAAGYHINNRDDYPVYDDGLSTKKIYGQLKVRHRKGLRYNSTLKYRYEKITDQYISGRGLFEESGYGVLEPLVPTSNWVFYFQREDLRYQDITSLPTQVHKFEWRSTYVPNNQISINMGLNAKLDKNNDLDSLEVEHTSYQPNLFISYNPNLDWTFNTGFTYTYDKSSLPVTVALFDG